MEIHPLLRILFLLFPAFHSDINLIAQVPSEQFYLPYHDDPSGPFHIRTYVNFIVPPPSCNPVDIGSGG